MDSILTAAFNFPLVLSGNSIIYVPNLVSFSRPAIIQEINERVVQGGIDAAYVTIKRDYGHLADFDLRWAQAKRLLNRVLLGAILLTTAGEIKEYKESMDEVSNTSLQANAASRQLGRQVDAFGDKIQSINKELEENSNAHPRTHFIHSEIK
jgi:methyl-accepting chemotaxis protein